MKVKKISLFIVYLLSFIFMELLYKIFIYNHVFRISIGNMLLFLVFFSLIMTILTRLFKNDKYNKIVFIVLMSLISIWFCAEYVCKSYFDFYISLSTFEVADQLGGFVGKTITEILKRILGITLFFLPLILSLIFSKKINYKQMSIKKSLGLFCISLFVYAFYLLSLNIGKDKDYSAYDLYYNVNDVSLNMETFGVLNTFMIDAKRAVFGFEEKIVLDLEGNTYIDRSEPENTEEPTEIVYDYNNLDIDFNSLKNNESNNTLKTIHEYMSKNSGTLQNEYTGIFKNKNLILFMAESFNEIAVSKELTPTLYKLINSGFVFDNFYTPTIYSTIGGEFQEMTGLYAQSTGILSKFRSGNISFPQGVGNKFKELNYKVYAYHNNSYAFQDRNKYLKSLGFDNFKACYNGLEKLIQCHTWPQSDVDMINATYTDYINDDNFMVFYASVSGHSSYRWSTNAQAKKHKDEYMTHNLPYSEGPASYLAAQMELDQALESLIQKLDEAGKLSDTVIALVGDHYPYELTLDEVNEVSQNLYGYKKDAIITVNKSNFILWNSEMDTVHVDKVGSQIDVMPTIYNAFGLNYDSRLFIGNDILSTTPGLAMFGNRSWVTDKGMYYTASKKFVPNEGVEVDDDYLKAINQMVNNKITMSKLIIENNYYGKVFK